MDYLEGLQYPEDNSDNQVRENAFKALFERNEYLSGEVLEMTNKNYILRLEIESLKAQIVEAKERITKLSQWILNIADEYGVTYGE